MSFLLQQVLLEPGRILQLSNAQLNQLLCEGRSSRLLASLAFELHSTGLDREIPPEIDRHLLSVRLVHEKQRRDLDYDSEKILLALQSVGEKLVLLKGAAYIVAELPVARGRLITDIDILVPHARIDKAEQALIASGWEPGAIDAYDDHYYRKWGHEIPPLTNKRRETTLDVHHNILPPTSGPNVDASLLFDNLIEVRPGIYTLGWKDMVIHSATHLFHEGEFHHGLRDLWDLDRMLRDFPLRDPHFWDSLVHRARELELLDSLFHGLTYAQAVFETPIPQAVIEDAGNWARILRKPVMDFLFRRAFRPDTPQCELPFTALALNLLYIRSHYLRLPIYLLLPHLARKAWMRQFKGKSDSTERPDPQDG